MLKLRVFSGAELCNFLSEHGFVAAKFLFQFRCIANSTAAHYAE